MRWKERGVMRDREIHREKKRLLKICDEKKRRSKRVGHKDNARLKDLGLPYTWLIKKIEIFV